MVPKVGARGARNTCPKGRYRGGHTFERGFKKKTYTTLSQTRPPNKKKKNKPPKKKKKKKKNSKTKKKNKHTPQNTHPKNRVSFNVKALSEQGFHPPDDLSAVTHVLGGRGEGEKVPGVV